MSLDTKAIRERSDSRTIHALCDEVDELRAERDGYRAFAVRLAALVATPGTEDYADKVTPADLDTLAEVVEGEYERGHGAGDRDRFARYKVDLARALGLDDRRVPEWGVMIETVRAARADVDELRPTLANERGEGEPPEAGWEWIRGQWETKDGAFGLWECIVNGKSGRWRFEWVNHDDDDADEDWPEGIEPTARAAMRAATAALKATP